MANGGVGDTRSISVTTSRRRFVVFLWGFFLLLLFVTLSGLSDGASQGSRSRDVEAKN